jgi:hypothetical protein
MIRRLKPQSVTDWIIATLIAAAVVIMIGCAIENRQRIDWFGHHHTKTTTTTNAPPQP